MKRNTPRPLAAIAAVCGAAALLASAHATGSTDAARPPASAKKPEAVFDLKSTVSQTAAIVEGEVSDVQHEYSDAEGPWTRVVLTGVKAHMGKAPATVEIRHFGGPLPNGRALVAAELPAFVKGKRYVVFLRNTAWNLSPVVGELALRSEMVEGREVLVNSDGLVVTGVSKRGVEFGQAIFDALPLDGGAPKLLGKKLAELQRQPLERAGFVQAMAGAVSANSLAVGGAFYAMPAGEFKWRNNATSPRPGFVPPAASAEAAKAAPEVDTTRPN